jgi:hypothetical protein
MDPDGLIFEVLVALSCAACGWEVEFLAEQSTKTPDMVARWGADDLYIAMEGVEAASPDGRHRVDSGHESS